MHRDETDLQVLRQLFATPDDSQRALAARLGISVGKLNYCLQALIAKGWVKVNNFRHSNNKLAYTYLLTTRGMHAKFSLTRSFIERKEEEFEALQIEIRDLKRELEAAGIGRDSPPFDESIETSTGRFFRNTEEPTSHADDHLSLLGKA
ncbi:hypothetical protein RGE_41250 [Rubrivivax gelatinosus IL144]|uniref:MarR family EPS-associated transcriptional regulator n=2 Tax=Rubrivivax gelatinosus TaxID=28068 RepID=I0HWS4_RUBGI|nr:hypothetical protein RGE_41250 [Rubrivivax gelatinosus IL144]